MPFAIHHRITSRNVTKYRCKLQRNRVIEAHAKVVQGLTVNQAQIKRGDSPILPPDKKASLIRHFVAEGEKTVPQ